jgi:hypothetical protein
VCSCWAASHNDAVDAGIEAVVLQSIVDEWESLGQRSFLKEWPDPWGVWVALHDALPPRADATLYLSGLRTPVRRVWFVDTNGLRERDVCEYARFWVMQIDRPWCKRFLTSEANPIFGRVYELGRAAFAAFDGIPDVYLEKIWGSRWGRALRLTIDESGKPVTQKDLWIS